MSFAKLLAGDAKCRVAGCPGSIRVSLCSSAVSHGPALIQREPRFRLTMDSRRASACWVGQTLVSVTCNIAPAHVDRQECLSYQNRPRSGLYFLSARKFVSQVGAHTSGEPRELEQIFQIAPRQIRQV